MPDKSFSFPDLSQVLDTAHLMFKGAHAELNSMTVLPDLVKALTKPHALPLELMAKAAQGAQKELMKSMSPKQIFPFPTLHLPTQKIMEMMDHAGKVVGSGNQTMMYLGYGAAVTAAIAATGYLYHTWAQPHPAAVAQAPPNPAQGHQ